MKLSFRNNVIGLSAETPEEQEICALLSATDGHIFQLHAATDRGMAFSEIGPEEEARRAPLNIVRTIEPRFAPISNLAHTPFVLDDLPYASIEGFWQGLKTAEPQQRQKFAKLSGAEAKAKGSEISQPPAVLYGGTTIHAGSPEHWVLMRKACEAKFTQNRAAREALLATGDRWLTHKVRRDSRTIPGAIMADIWMGLRAKLQDETAGLG
jgi:predicted NAD-dependent protein-ADP-ribosyltransferase YbiA (DUF1768 family)